MIDYSSSLSHYYTVSLFKNSSSWFSWATSGCNISIGSVKFGHQLNSFKALKKYGLSWDLKLETLILEFSLKV